MTITLDIRPEVQAELARQAAQQGRAIEAVAADLLDEAIQQPPRTSATSGDPPRTWSSCSPLCAASILTSSVIAIPAATSNCDGVPG